MLSCKEVSRLVSESLDRKLPFRQRIAVRIHLLMCKFCSRYRKQLFFIEKVAHQYAAKGQALRDTNGTLSVEARERMKRLLTNTDRSLSN